MDILSLIGIFLGIGAILVGQFLEGGHVSSLLNGPALLIVVGGTLGAIMLQAPITTFMRAVKLLKWIFFPPKLMADEAIQKIIRPCGLSPQKAKAIRNLSQILVAKHRGQVPSNFEDLEELPGVGHKTAGVVMAQAFGYPSFPVDTHIHRLAQRWRLTTGHSVTSTEADLKRLFPKDRWNQLHLQIIYYGREHCQARACFGLECEICHHCFPNRKRKVVTRKA